MQIQCSSYVTSYIYLLFGFRIDDFASWDDRSFFLIHLPSHECLPISTTSPLQCQKRKMAADHWPCKEIRTREPTLAFCVIQVCERAVCHSLVQPLSDTVQNVRAHRFGRHGGCFKLPIGFGIKMSGIQREAVLLHHGSVPRGLDLINARRDEVFRNWRTAVRAFGRAW